MEPGTDAEKQKPNQEKSRHIKLRKAAIVGTAYDQLKDRVEKYAEMDLPVLFIGETGSGKELFAKYYMELSKREGARMSVNCAAYADTILKAEVFGYVKGAFTDAKTNRQGHLRKCNNGILCLDELGDSSPEFQAAILRVSEGLPFNPVGSDEEVRNVDTLIIGATNNPLGIREDLKHRFHILPVPSLQKQDIPALAQHFYEGKILDKNILEDLMSREFRGNVRELKQECERLLSEKGEDIFYKGKRPLDLGIVHDLFDYERFYEEFFLWEKHLSPIIRKYKLDYRYKYFPLPEQTAPELAKNYLSAVITESPSLHRSRLKVLRECFRDRALRDRVGPALEDMPNVIKNLHLRENEQDSVTLFNYYLDTFFEIQDLNSFLHTFPNHTKIKNQKPDLRALLDFNPKEAIRTFKKIYYNYVLQKHNGSKADAAKALKINQNTLKSTLRALHIKEG